MLTSYWTKVELMCLYVGNLKRKWPDMSHDISSFTDAVSAVSRCTFVTESFGVKDILQLCPEIWTEGVTGTRYGWCCYMRGVCGPGDGSRQWTGDSKRKVDGNNHHQIPTISYSIATCYRGLTCRGQHYERLMQQYFWGLSTFHTELLLSLVTREGNLNWQWSSVSLWNIWTVWMISKLHWNSRSRKWTRYFCSCLTLAMQTVCFCSLKQWSLKSPDENTS